MARANQSRDDRASKILVGKGLAISRLECRARTNHNRDDPVSKIMAVKGRVIVSEIVREAKRHRALFDGYRTGEIRSARSAVHPVVRAYWQSLLSGNHALSYNLALPCAQPHCTVKGPVSPSDYRVPELQQGCRMLNQRSMTGCAMLLLTPVQSLKEAAILGITCSSMTPTDPTFESTTFYKRL
jgi:hypothetical protein